MTGNAHPKFDPQKHRRKSIRLQGYDYSQAGAYFVTIVTYHRDSLFGEIVNKGIILNDFGKIADECWRAIPEHFPFVELGAFIIMPNHVHGIIVIHNDHGVGRGDAMRRPYHNHHTPQGTKTEFIGGDHWFVQIRRFTSHQQGI